MSKNVLHPLIQFGLVLFLVSNVWTIPSYGQSSSKGGNMAIKMMADDERRLAASSTGFEKSCHLQRAAAYDCAYAGRSGCKSPYESCGDPGGAASSIAPPIDQATAIINSNQRQAAAVTGAINSIGNSLTDFFAARAAKYEAQRRAEEAQTAQIKDQIIQDRARSAALDPEMDREENERIRAREAARRNGQKKIEISANASPQQGSVALQSLVAVGPPAFPEEGWTPWYRMMDASGTSESPNLDIAYWLGNYTGGGVRDYPTQWVIRNRYQEPVTVHYQLYIQCMQECVSGVRNLQVTVPANSVAKGGGGHLYQAYDPRVLRVLVPGAK